MVATAHRKGVKKAIILPYGDSMKYTLAQWARENNPKLLDEWDWENNQYDPEKIGFRSKKEASWICELGHLWEAVISTRTARGDGCPYCSGKRVLAGFNDLATTDEKLAKEFHPT